MNRAFTLVELLVVIAVVALLASMLMPAIGSVRDAARATSCAANLRQLAIAFHGYADDNDGIHVPMNPLDGTAVNGQWWPNQLAGGGYLPDAGWRHGQPTNLYGDNRGGVFRCPMVVTEAQMYWGGGYGVLEDAAHGHWYPGLVPQTASYGGELHRARIGRPAERALVIEAERFVNAAYRTSPSVACPRKAGPVWDSQGASDFRAAVRHGRGRSTLAFHDGHVGAMAYADLKANVGDVWRHDAP